MTILSVISRQPWRITLAADSAPSLTASDYVLSRQDGGFTSTLVSNVWSVGGNTVELALSDALDDGVVFIVSMPNAPGAPSAPVSYRGAAAPPAALPPGEDPEAEAYGIDVDWLSGAFSSDGDIVQVVGRQCLINDTLTVALIEEGEIFHRPDDGVGLPQSVNGPATAPMLSAMRGRLKRQWLKDSRIASVDSIDFVIDSNGAIYPNAKLTDAVSGESFAVVVPKGGS